MIYQDKGDVLQGGSWNMGHGRVLIPNLTEDIASRIALALDALYWLGYFNSCDVVTESRRIADQCGQVKYLRAQNANVLFGWEMPR